MADEIIDVAAGLMRDEVVSQHLSGCAIALALETIAMAMAHYCCLRGTSMFLLLALVHAMRDEYDSELPPCISGGCWELDRFRFSEREVEDLPDFVRRLKGFIDVEWPTVSKSNGSVPACSEVTQI